MRHLQGLYIILFLALTTAPGCKKKEKEDLAVPLKSEDFLNVSYGAAGRNAMDVYLPEIRGRSTPVIVLVHGGSWFEGDKSFFTDLAKYWRGRGYAAITMNYRLTHTPENNIHPAQVNDIGKALDFIAAKSEDWHISSNRFALQGASAGGHLSLLYSYRYEDKSRVKAVISMAGPTDLTMVQLGSPALADVVRWLIGKTYSADPNAYLEASPVNHVDKNSVPTLLFHGKLDVVVPYQQAEILKQKLDQKAAVSKLVLYGDTGHEVLNLNNTAGFLAECEKWFDLYLR